MQWANLISDQMVVAGRARDVVPIAVPSISGTGTSTLGAIPAGHRYRIVAGVFFCPPTVAFKFQDQQGTPKSLTPVLATSVVTAGGSAVAVLPPNGAGYGDTGTGDATNDGIDINVSAISGGTLSGWIFVVDLDQGT